LKRPIKWEHFDSVIRNPDISTSARCLYAILTTYADKDGICWPGIERLAAEMGTTRRTISNLIKELVEKKAISVVRRGKTLTNVYSLTGEVMGNTFPITEEVMGNIFPSDGKSISYVMGNLATSKMGSSLTAARDSGNRTAQYNSKKEQLSNLGGKKPPKKNSDNSVDSRVRIVQQKFYDCFKQYVGIEPTKAAFDWGRDGKRIKKLPDSYTAEMLVDLIPRFFKSPGYISRDYSFQSFINAIPQLLKQEVPTNGKTRVKPKEPSRDFSDW